VREGRLDIADSGKGVWEKGNKEIKGLRSGRVVVRELF
jgi:hypothetical protein